MNKLCFCLAMVVALQVARQSAARRMMKDREASRSSSPMTVTRQGANLYSGKKQEYEFQDRHLHKEYVVELSEDKCDKPVFVKYGTGKLCSTGAFTTRELTCTAIDNKKLEAVVANYSHLTPSSDRGFSFEFEMVSRELTQKYKDKVRNRWGGGEIAGVKACFEDATSNADNKEALARWNWEEDGSVTPLEETEAEELGLDASETRGVAFEVTAPGPPNVLSGSVGFRQGMEMLTVLRHMGVQAGPSSGLHVHVNVLNQNVPGTPLTQAGVASVWTAYAKYQLVIDEMYSPGRPGNYYAGRMFLGHCKALTRGDCTDDPCGCSRRVFNQLHNWITSGKTGNTKKFCNAVLKMPGENKPCNGGYPDVRYMQLNLTPLKKYGTLEFRAHSATYDQERIAQWAQFVVAFVDHFGSGEGQSNAFFSGTESDDYASLVKAQREATIDDLFNELRDRIDAGTAQFFKGRVWEVGDKSCKMPGTTLNKAKATCESDSGGDDWDWDDDDDWFPWSSASLVEQQGDVQKLRFKVHPRLRAGNYVHVKIPQGGTRAVKVDESALTNGFMEFEHNPTALLQQRSLLRGDQDQDVHEDEEPEEEENAE